MSAFWIDIEAQYGVKLGTIRTASEWRQVRRLSRAGEFSFTMPAGDPQAALIVRKRVARCFTIQDGTLVEIGSGKVLTGLARRISKDVTGSAINSLEDIDTFLAGLA